MHTHLYKPIGRKLIVATILPLLLIALSLWAYSYTAPLLESEWRQDLELVFSMNRERLLADVARISSYLKITEEDSELRKFLADVPSADQAGGNPFFNDTARILSGMKKMDPHIKTVWIVNHNQKFTLCDNGEVLNSSMLSSIPWHANPADTPRPVISDAHMDKNNNIVFSIAQRLEHNGQITGYAGIDIDIADVDGSVYSLRLHKNTEVIVLDARGHIMSHTMSEARLPAPTLSSGEGSRLREEIKGLEGWKEITVREALPGADNSGHKPAQERTYYIYTEKIPSLQWSIVIKISREFVDSSNVALLAKTFISVIMGLTCCILLAIINFQVKGQYQSLLYRERLLSTVFDNMPVALMVRDREGRGRLTNPEYMRIMELGKEQLIGKKIEDMPYADLSNTLRGLYTSVNRWNKYEFNVNILGREKSLITSIHPIKGEDGQDLFVAMLQDITQRKKDETRLINALEKAEHAQTTAERASKAQSEFLARMSHEIRTPMNAIIGLGNILLRTEVTSQQYAYLIKLRNAASNLLHLINEVLDFSKIEAGKLDINYVEFEPVAVMKNLADLVCYAAEEKNLEIIFNISPDLPAVLVGDPERISQILINLVNNSLKFTPKGQITVSMYVENKSKHNYLLKISVKDTGIGISADIQPVLFKPFVQADGSITRKYGGTGLGLTICKKLAELMQGGIKVESSPNKGSKFTVTLMVGKAPQGEPLLSEVAEYKGLYAHVVDNNKDSSAILSRHLKALGFNASSSQSGGQALDAARFTLINKKPFDLIIIDYRLRDTPSLKLAEELKKMLSHNVLIALTMTESDMANSVDMFTTSIDGHIIKPVLPTMLAEALRDTFSAPEMPDLIQLAAGKEETHEPAEKKESPGLEGVKILLVEDNDINMEIASELLTQAGALVTPAENGQEALEKALQNKFDLIVMDMQMPVMDGLEATRRIRASNKPEIKKLPIIAMTANAMEEDRNACLASGMNDFISKPFNIDEMLKTLSVWHERGKNEYL